jgi:hypothetical protein
VDADEQGQSAVWWPAVASGLAGMPCTSSLAVSPSSAFRKLCTRTITGDVSTAPGSSRG